MQKRLLDALTNASAELHKNLGKSFHKDACYLCQLRNDHKKLDPVTVKDMLIKDHHSPGYYL